MGTVIEQITLTNYGDVREANDGFIPKGKVKSVTVNAVVDTSASTMVINEHLAQVLGLKLLGTGTATAVGGVKVPMRRAEPLEIKWHDRQCTCQPYVILGDTDDILLGAIPLEDMDLMVDPTERKLVGAHGAEQMYFIL
jgi:clan AA aspartic protease